MNFMGVGYNSKSKGYLTYNPNKKSSAGYFIESKVLSVWKGMIKRVYTNLHPYEGCSVTPDWLDFQNFAEFYYNDKWRQDGWHIDKDILVKDNKLYSPETCCFVPPELNMIIVNYKGISNRKNSYLPTGVSVHRKTGLYRARVNDSLNGKGSVKYFTSLEEASNEYQNMKKIEIMKLLNKWKECIDPEVYKFFSARII